MTTINSHWIKWNGGECPVTPSTRVEVKFRSGKVAAPCFSFHYIWNHLDRGGDIVEYRIVIEQADLDAAEKLLSDNGYTITHPTKPLTVEDVVTIQIRHRYTDAVLFECEAPEDLNSGLHMRHALEKAVEAHANLRDADLSGAYLSGAYLRGANLRGANLRDSDLVGADLDGSDLSDANLRGVDLGEAYLGGASFGEGVTAEQGVLQLIGLRWDVIIFDAHMRIGCQMHPLSDWASFDDRRIAEMDGVHALRFWRRHKSDLLTLAQRGNAPATIAKAEGDAA